jgi:hypothetical protein
MSAWFDGFWQVIIDDPDEDIQPTPRTTIAVRASACWIYSGSHYMEFRAEKQRPLATVLPLADDVAAEMFRSHRATGGRVTWSEHDGVTSLMHEPTIAVDPRHMQAFGHELRRNVDGSVTMKREGPAGNADETWRQLSGPALRPIAGAWESVDDEERYVYLVTGAHYGVMRSPVNETDVGRRAVAGEKLSVQDEAALLNAGTFNGGARLMGTRTIDHWPMFASYYGYEVNKHPTFYVPSITDDELKLSFGRDEPAAPWRRIG